MREIKFRVWSDFYEKYADFDAELYMDGSVEADFTDGTGIPHHETTDLVVEQYTGLKDKNGKEIYEGDIVRYTIWLNGAAKKLICTKVVKWWSGEEEEWPCCTTSGFSLPRSEDGYEVIGNIHENPELPRGENPNDN